MELILIVLTVFVEGVKLFATMLNTILSSSVLGSLIMVGLVVRMIEHFIKRVW